MISAIDPPPVSAAPAAPVRAGIAIEVIADLRHDLRNPINHLIGYAELALEIAEEHDVSAAVCAHLGSIARVGHSAAQVVSTWLAENPHSLTAFHLIALRDRLLATHDRLARAIRQLLLAVADREVPEVAEETRRLQAAAKSFHELIQNIPYYARRKAVPEAAPPIAVLPESRGHSPTAMPSARTVLIVDDEDANREILARCVERDGYSVVQAGNGTDALALLERHSFECVLLDIRMPGLDGIRVLERMKNGASRDVPVIMISALDDMETVGRCIEAGAEDYLPKPFNPVLVRTRLGFTRERKRLRDAERLQAGQLREALERTRQQTQVVQDLLLNILPASVAEELQQKGVVAPLYFADVTIVLTDFVGFARSTEQLAAEDLVSVLNDYFTSFDLVMKHYGVEKLKTIGDSYMYVSGMPDVSSSHPVDAVLAAVEILDEVQRRGQNGSPVDWKIRIGIHTGPVIAGVVGTHKFAFDVWGDTVNFASRMESTCEPDRINLSDKTFARVKDFFRCQKRENVVTKDGHQVSSYLFEGLVPALRGQPGESAPPAFKRRYGVYFRKELAAFPVCLTQSGNGPASL